MTRREIEDEAKIMSVALNQPHWIGKTYHPSNGWMSTSLGCFCRDHWTSRETQKDYWDIGDRYAQIIDDERIARGLTPRQCAAAADPPKETTDEERADARRKAERALRDAEDEIRMVDNKAVRVLQRLCWDDLDIAANDVGRAFNGLYRLSVHFERLDTARRIR
jgi:hypothetical protein